MVLGKWRNLDAKVKLRDFTIWVGSRWLSDVNVTPTLLRGFGDNFLVLVFFPKIFNQFCIILLTLFSCSRVLRLWDFAFYGTQGNEYAWVQLMTRRILLTRITYVTKHILLLFINTDVLPREKRKDICICVCIYVYTICVYIQYIYMCVCIYKYTYMYIQYVFCIYTHINIYTHTYIFIYIYMYVCLYTYVYVCVCIYVYTLCVYICIYIMCVYTVYIYVFVCIDIYSVCVCI